MVNDIETRETCSVGLVTAVELAVAVAPTLVPAAGAAHTSTVLAVPNSARAASLDAVYDLLFNGADLPPRTGEDNVPNRSRSPRARQVLASAALAGSASSPVNSSTEQAEPEHHRTDAERQPSERDEVDEVVRVVGSR
jgi:hypothetical protein